MKWILHHHNLKKNIITLMMALRGKHSLLTRKLFIAPFFVSGMQPNSFLWGCNRLATGIDMEEDEQGYLKPQEVQENMYDVAGATEEGDYDLTPSTGTNNVDEVEENEEDGTGNYDLAEDVDEVEENEEDGTSDHDLAENVDEVEEPKETNTGDDIDNQTEVGSECSDEALCDFPMGFESDSENNHEEPIYSKPDKNGFDI